MELPTFDYTPISPILIKIDNDFTNYGFPGNGLAIDPYIIEDYEIITGGSYGINISNVSSYFIIQNCYIEAQNPIVLNFILGGNGTIYKNTIISSSGIGYGISVDNSLVPILISDNTILECGRGIYIDTLNQFLILGNHFEKNDYTIYARGLTNSDVSFNTFIDNKRDFYYYPEDCLFYKNIWEKNDECLLIDFVYEITIKLNVFLENRKYAISILTGAIDSAAYANYFVENGLNMQLSQVYDESGPGMKWYDVVFQVGNFWSDLKLDRYQIEGTSDKYDLYPSYNSDTDELNNYEEYLHGTLENSDDTDGDTMPDHYEVYNGLNPLFNDAFEDPDSDLLTNIQEYWEGTQPQIWDTDLDLLSDGYEVLNGLNPLISDAGKDLDGDGLSNWEEFLLGTIPNKVDSDNDGMNDFWENDNGLDPLENDAWADPDNDLLNNFLEYIYGCDPFSNDTDGDSHIDSWEIAHGTNPNDSSDYPDEIFETNTEESPFDFVYVVLSFITLSGLFIFKRRK